MSSPKKFVTKILTVSAEVLPDGRLRLHSSVLDEGEIKALMGYLEQWFPKPTAEDHK